MSITVSRTVVAEIAQHSGARYLQQARCAPSSINFREPEQHRIRGTKQ